VETKVRPDVAHELHWIGEIRHCDACCRCVETALVLLYNDRPLTRVLLEFHAAPTDEESAELRDWLVQQCRAVGATRIRHFEGPLLVADVTYE
jgi:hypothetical protein